MKHEQCIAPAVGQLYTYRRRKPFQRESKNERHIKENKSIAWFKTVSLVPSGGVSILVVHGFRNIPVYLYNKLARWRARLKEILVLTNEENIHQGRWKNRQLQLKEHLLNNSFSFHPLGNSLVIKTEVKNKTICSKGQHEPNQWSALSTTLIHPTALKGSIPWGNVLEMWEHCSASRTRGPASWGVLQARTCTRAAGGQGWSTDISHLAYIKS